MGTVNFLLKSFIGEWRVAFEPHHRMRLRESHRWLKGWFSVVYHIVAAVIALHRAPYPRALAGNLG